MRSIDTSPDGRWLVAATQYATGEDWLTLWPTDGRGRGLALRGGEANQAIFSPSGDEIAAAGMDGVLGIYRVDGDGTPAIELRGRSSGSMGITSIVYTPDGEGLISVGHDETIRVWDRASSSMSLVPGGGLARGHGWSPLRARSARHVDPRS